MTPILSVGMEEEEGKKIRRPCSGLRQELLKCLKESDCMTLVCLFIFVVTL